MTKVKNTSFTLFRWQEYIWKPGETIEFNDNNLNPWEDRLANTLTQEYKNLVIVNEQSLKEQRIANLAKAREARKAKREQSNSTT